jgi:hypothetical protein
MGRRGRPRKGERPVEPEILVESTAPPLEIWPFCAKRGQIVPMIICGRCESAQDCKELKDKIALAGNGLPPVLEKEPPTK